MSKDFDKHLADFVSAHARRRLRALGLNPKVIGEGVIRTHEEFSDILDKAKIRKTPRTTHEVEPTQAATGDSPVGTRPPRDPRREIPRTPVISRPVGPLDVDESCSATIGPAPPSSLGQGEPGQGGSLSRSGGHSTGTHLPAETSHILQEQVEPKESTDEPRTKWGKLTVLVLLLIMLTVVLSADVQSLFY